MEQLDITKMTLEQLEALAYREIKKLELAKYNLQLLEQEMAKKQEVKEVEVVEKKK